MIAGSDSTQGMFVARYTTAGALDGSFSGNGYAEINPAPAGEAPPSRSEATTVGVDAAGRIIADMVVAGNLAWVAGDTGNTKHGIARFATDTLTPDGGFGSGGVVALDGGGVRSEIVVAGDGSVTLASNLGFRLQL